MVSLFLLLGCNLSYIVDLFPGLHELASASTRTLLKLASSVRGLLKPYGQIMTECKKKSKIYNNLPKMWLLYKRPELVSRWKTRGECKIKYNN